MSSLNKVQLIGRVGQDPEYKATQSGTAVVNFSIATTEKWKKDGQQQEKTEWHDCCCFGKLADIINSYVKKGSLIYVEGSLETQKWEDKTSGQPRKATKIKVKEMRMLGGKSEDTGSAPTGNNYQSQPSPSQMNQQLGQEYQAADITDEIPF